MLYTRAGLFMTLAGLLIFMTFIMTELDIANIGVENPAGEYSEKKTYINVASGDEWELELDDYGGSINTYYVDVYINGVWRGVIHPERYEDIGEQGSLFIWDSTEQTITGIFDDFYPVAEVRATYVVEVESATGAWGMLQTFWALITFQAIGMPVWFTTLFIYPLTFGLLYLTIEIVKDLIPFT